MKVCNFGSINIDHVYSLPHFVLPGETLDTSSYSIFPGGKGLNQSIALARSGAEVCHAGAVGRDGLWLLKILKNEGISVEHVRVRDEPGGHAVIQVVPSGENAIFIHGGANRSLRRDEISSAIKCFSEDDYLLLQNEINEVPFIIETAFERKLKVVFNPAPMDADVKDYPLDCVNMLILNEVEGAALTGRKEPMGIMDALRVRYADTSIVLTLGNSGVMYADGSDVLLKVPAFRVKAVDTTAAGDTFTGYLLGSLCRKMPIEEALKTANKAAALSVTIKGAAGSIPAIDALNNHTLDEFIDDTEE